MLDLQQKAKSAQTQATSNHPVVLLVKSNLLVCNKQLGVNDSTLLIIQHFSCPVHSSLGFSLDVTFAWIIINLPVFVSTHYNVIRHYKGCSAIPCTKSSKDSGHKGSPISGCLFHLCILLPFLTNHLLPNICAPLRWTKIRELICIQTNPKEAWPVFSFPAHHVAVQNRGRAREEMKWDWAAVAVLPYAIFRYFWSCLFGTVLLLKLMLATFFKARIPLKLKYVCMFVVLNIYSIHIY